MQIRRGLTGLIFFILFIILLGGYQTLKGTFKGAVEGAKKDWGLVEEDVD